MNNLVSSFMTEDDFSKLNSDVSGLIGQVKPFGTSMNASERKGVRTMAEDREGYARLICRLALTHVEQLPRNEVPAKMEESLNYFDALSKSGEAVAHLQEMLDDTRVALGVDIMSLADRYAAYLQVARRGNVSLDAAMTQVDEYNSRFGTGGEEAQQPETPAK